MVAQPMGPIYNNLIVFDPHNYPQIIGDLAKILDGLGRLPDLYLHAARGGEVPRWQRADVGRRQGQLGPDRLSARGVVSPRRSNYPMIKSIEAPDRLTVVFRLHHPSPSFLTSLAHPANFIYAKKYLDGDVHYYKNHAVGTGPFKLKNTAWLRHRTGAQPQLLEKGFPYLDGIKYFIIRDDGARAKAIRAGRVDVELRFLPLVKWKASRRRWAIRWWWRLQVHRHFWGHDQCGQEAL